MRLRFRFLLTLISKEAMCRVAPLIDILDIISCDCTGLEEDCFTSSGEGSIVAEGWACPFIEQIFSVRSTGVRLY